MNGGIVPQLLDRIVGFKFGSGHFDSCSLPLTLPDTYEVKESEAISKFFDNFKNTYSSKYWSESRLRVLLWDYLITVLSCERKEEALIFDIVPELDVKDMLGLENSRKIDLALVSKYLDLATFFIEYALEDSEGTFGHKDFNKLASVMTIACIRLCQKLQELGLDPSTAQTFGMLVGGTRLQMMVARPIITDNDGVIEIHVVIVMNSHWNMSLLKFDNSTPFTCSDKKCCESPLHTVTLHNPVTKFDFKNYKEERTKKLKMDDDDKDTYVPESHVSKDSLRDGDELNIESIKKIDSFIKCAKRSIKQWHGADSKGDKEKCKKLQVPNIANVPRSLPNNQGFTPDTNRISRVNNKTAEGSNRSLLGDGSYHRKTKNLTFEYNLYKEYFRNSSIFPQMISADVDYKSKTVTYTFEKMSDFIGSGDLGLYIEHGKFFGPQIRDKHPEFVILEAATLALHVLYGLYFLHEELGIIHGDISPRNIMFSCIDDIWKLIDFETALPLEVSLKTKRSIGTPGYICPEAQESGIYDKSSDIYSLGKVIWTTFVMKLIVQVENSEDLPRETHEAVDELMNIVREMIQTSSSDRPSTKKLLTKFYAFMRKNLLAGFNIYGKKLMIPRIEALISDENGKSDDDNITFTKISINE